MLNAAEGAEKWVSRTLLAGMETGAVTLENSSTASFKTAYITTLRPRVALLGVSPRKTKNFHSHRNLDTNVHSRFICNSHESERNHMSFNGRIIKHCGAPDHGLLTASSDGGGLLVHRTARIPVQRTARGAKANPTGCVQYDSVYITFLR